MCGTQSIDSCERAFLLGCIGANTRPVPNVVGAGPGEGIWLAPGRARGGELDWRRAGGQTRNMSLCRIYFPLRAGGPANLVGAGPGAAKLKEPPKRVAQLR